MRHNIPQSLLNMSKKSLMELMDCVAANWVVNDERWFQAVELTRGMNDAKRCNDSCRARFSPFEAWAVKNFLSLPEKPGLRSLKGALNFRVHTRVNTSSIVDEGTDKGILIELQTIIVVLLPLLLPSI